MTELDKYISLKLHQEFVFGKNDCITFAVGAVKAATGIDHLKDINKWNSAMTGRGVLKKLKHKDIIEAFDVRFRQHKNISKLQDGDVVFVDNPADTTFQKYSATVYYKGKLVGVSSAGMITFNVTDGSYFFNVRSLRVRG